MDLELLFTLGHLRIHCTWAPVWPVYCPQMQASRWSGFLASHDVVVQGRSQQTASGQDQEVYSAAYPDLDPCFVLYILISSR